MHTSSDHSITVQPFNKMMRDAHSQMTILPETSHVKPTHIIGRANHNSFIQIPDDVAWHLADDECFGKQTMLQSDEKTLGCSPA